MNTFDALAIEFLKKFQLPIRYETGTELLTSFRQDTATHIFDHIHEWRRRRRLVKAPIPDFLLTDRFCKSLLPQIARDVALGGAVLEDQSICHAQHLDLIYSQSGTLYDIIPYAPVNPNPPTTQHPGAHADGIIGATSGVAVKQLSGSVAKLAVDPSTKATALPATIVNSVQSTQKSSGKNKKNKNKTAPSEEQSSKYPNLKQKVVVHTDVERDKGTNYSCKICLEDHVT